MAANINLPSTTIDAGATANFRNTSSGGIFTFTIPSLSGGGTFSGDNPGGTGQNKIIAFSNLSNFTGVLQMSTSGASFIYQLSNLNDTVASNIRFAGNAQSLANPDRLRYVGSAGLTLTNRAIELAKGANSFVAIDNNGTNNSSLIINSNLAVTTTGAKTLTFGGSNTGGTSTFAGTINDGTSAVISLNKANANTWSLTNTSNGFTGAISVNAGTLAYASAGGANGITFSNTTGGATLTYTGATGKTMSGAINASTVTTGTITLGSSGSGAVNYSNTASLGSAGSGIKNLILTGTNAGNNILAGGWNNNTGGAATLTKNEAGKWILSGTNTYTGATIISAGTLQFAKQTALYNNATASWTAANIRVASGATLGLNVGGTGEFTTSNITTLLTNLASSSNMTTNGMASGSRFAFDTSNVSEGSFMIADVIANSIGAAGGSRGLTKLGTGSLVLTNTNTYTGSTTISAGMLAITGTGSINASSGITVASGAHFKYNSSTALTAPLTLSAGSTLSGSGTVSVDLALNSTAQTLAPGNSPGIQTLATTQNWSSFTYEWEINNFIGTTVGTDFDQIAITGDLNLTGNTAGSYVLDILSLTSGNLAGGVPDFAETSRTWNILTTTGSINSFNAAYWTLNTDGFTSDPAWQGDWSLGLNGTNNALVLSYNAIPEPKAALLGGLGLLLLLRRRR